MKTLLALVFLVGCAADGSSLVEGEPQQHLPKTQAPTFTLYVSNQSLDRQVLDIQVYIDGELAVSGDFDVFTRSHGEGGGCGGEPLLAQHNWYEFEFALPPGAHEITVASDDVAATLQTTNDKKFGVINYWYDAMTDEPEHFQFFASAEQPAFL